MVNANRAVVVALGVLLLSGGLLGCGKKEEPGPAERLGQSLDQAAEDLAEGVEKAKEDLEDSRAD